MAGQGSIPTVGGVLGAAPLGAQPFGLDTSALGVTINDQRGPFGVPGSPGLLGVNPETISGFLGVANGLRGTGITGLNVVSGYRSQANQDRLRERNPNAARNSRHTKRDAIDVTPTPDTRANRAAVAAQAAINGFQGFGSYGPKGISHIDMGPARSWGSFNPDEQATIDYARNVGAIPSPNPARNAVPSYSQAQAALTGPVAAGPIGAALNAQPATPVERARQDAAKAQQERVAAVEEAQQNAVREQAASALGIPGVTSPLDNFGPVRDVPAQSTTAPSPAIGIGALGPVEGPFGLGTLEAPSVAPQGPVTIDQVPAAPQAQQTAPPTVQQAPQVSAAPAVAAPAQGTIGSTAGRQGVSTVTGLAPAVERAIQGMGLGPASAGFSYGYSPMGGVAAVHANAPEAVQAAATGPGLMGALGISPKGQERVARTALGVIGGLIGGPALGAIGVPASGFLSGLAARGLGKRASASVTGQTSRGGSSSGRGGSSGSAGVGGTGRGGAADREGAGMSDRG